VTRFGRLFPDPDAEGAARLRGAHVKVRLYREAGCEIPARLLLLESEYRRWRRRVRLGRAAEVPRAA
jgi:hypothetical protein